MIFFPLFFFRLLWSFLGFLRFWFVNSAGALLFVLFSSFRERRTGRFFYYSNLKSYFRVSFSNLMAAAKRVTISPVPSFSSRFSSPGGCSDTEWANAPQALSFYDFKKELELFEEFSCPFSFLIPKLLVFRSWAWEPVLKSESGSEILEVTATLTDPDSGFL